MSVLIVILVCSIAAIGLGLLLAYYSRSWEARWRGRHIKVVNRSMSEELWVDGELVARNRSHGMAMSVVLTGLVEDPEAGSLPLRARIHMDNGLSVQCELTIGGEVVPTVAGAGMLDEAPASEEAIPVDPRWAAAVKLLRKVREEGDASVRDAANALQDALRDTLLALEHLGEAADAHAVLGGAAEGLAPLEARWGLRADEVVAMVRELHLAVVSRHSPDASDQVEAIQDLVRRLEAEAEVDAGAIADVAGLDLSRLPRELPTESSAPRSRPGQETRE